MGGQVLRGNGGLLPGPEVPHRDDSLLPLPGATDHGEGDAPGRGVAELLPELLLAEVDLGRTSDAYGLVVRLKVSVPGIERDVAQRLVEAAEQVCAYSRATRGNIDVAINLV